MDALAKALNAHDDLSDSIKDFSSKNESEILDQISRSEDVLRRVQAEAGNDDAILRVARPNGTTRSEEHTSELQSLMRISYAVFCLKKKKQQHHNNCKRRKLRQNTCKHIR